jgi:hypothetical protein
MLCRKAVEKYVENVFTGPFRRWKKTAARFSTAEKTAFQQTF